MCGSRPLCISAAIGPLRAASYDRLKSRAAVISLTAFSEDARFKTTEIPRHLHIRLKTSEHYPYSLLLGGFQACFGPRKDLESNSGVARVKAP